MPKTPNANRNRGDTKGQSARHYAKMKAINAFHCTTCGKSIASNQMLQHHLGTKRHILNFIYY